MTNTHTQPVIIGIVPVGTVVTVDHPGHPHNGQSFVIVGDNGPTGGVAGGGVVRVMSATDSSSTRLSRYTRVTVHQS